MRYALVLLTAALLMAQAPKPWLKKKGVPLGSEQVGTLYESVVDTIDESGVAGRERLQLVAMPPAPTPAVPRLYPQCTYTRPGGKPNQFKLTPSPIEVMVWRNGLRLAKGRDFSLAAGLVDVWPKITAADVILIDCIR